MGSTATATNLSAQSAALSPASLLQYSTKDYSPDARWVSARHLEYLDGVLLDAINGGKKRLLISCPPRFGKSTLFSTGLPSWFLGSNPDKRAILVGHTFDLAADFSHKARTILEESGPEVFGVSIDGKRSARNDWQIEGRKGGCLAVGVGGPVLGRGGDLIVVDDIVKNSDQATSETFQRSFRDWWNSTLMTRLEPGGTVILTGTRWTDDDPIAWLLEQDDWEYINLPALSLGKGDPLNRPKGQSLWPARWPEDALAAKKRDLGTRWFSAAYQGQPVPADGVLFDPSWRQTVPAVPHDTRRCRAWDLASSARRGDYSVGCLASMTELPSDKAEDMGDRFFVLEDITRGQWGPAEVERQIRKTAEEDGAWCPILIEVEPGSSGKLYFHHLCTVLQGFTVYPIPPSGSKQSRWQGMLAAWEAGTAAVLDADWNKAWWSEVERLPNGAHDDQTDAAGMCFNFLSGKARQGRINLTVV